MLFKPEDLMTESYDPIQEAANILNESVYLNESESLLSPVAIPVVENARIGACVVAYNDVERLAEDHGVDYIDAMVGIAEANGIDMDHLAVSVPEWKIIANPEVVNELSNVIVAPISQYHPVYQFCEACVDTAIDEDDETWIDYMVDVFTEAFSDEKNAAAQKAIDKMQADIDQLKANYKTADKWDKKAIEEKIVAKGKALKAYKERIEKQTKSLGKQEKRDAENKNDAKFRAMGLTPGKSYTPEQTTKALEHTKKRSERETKRNMNAGLADEIADARGEGKNDNAEVPAETKSLLDKVKSAAKWPVEKISQAISSLKSKYQDLKTKIQNTPPEKRSIFQKFMNLIMSAIDKLSNLLSSKKSEESAA